MPVTHTQEKRLIETGRRGVVHFRSDDRRSTMFDLVYPENEEERLETLSDYEEVASEAQADLDALTSLAGRLLDTSAAFLAFMRRDEQIIQSARGIPLVVTERRQTFCSNVVATGEALEIPDAGRDSRFSDHPMVTGHSHLRFYFGVPLVAESGEVIGTFCVTGSEPRKLEPEERETLEILASQAMSQLELRRKRRELTAEVNRARRAEARFKGLLDASPDPIVLLDGESIVSYNGSAKAFLALDDGGDLIGRTVFDVLKEWGVHDDLSETRLRLEAARAQRGGARRFEWLQPCADGESRPVEVTVAAVELEAQQHTLLILHDITQQKENQKHLEREHRQAEKANRIKDTFLSMISHDLKSPLSSIFSMLELLEEEDRAQGRTDRRAIYGDLKSSVALLLEMTTQLLNLHRLQSGAIEIRRERIEPSLMIDQVRLSLDQRMQEKGITFDNRYPPGAWIEADVALFREVLFNLLSNAVKFCGNGDTISVVRGSEGYLEVVDTGVGIAEERLPDLFEKEKRTSSLGTDGEPGTGLGLPLCRDIMVAHGGEISVDSRIREGSRFTLRFPSSATVSHGEGV